MPKLSASVLPVFFLLLAAALAGAAQGAPDSDDDTLRYYLSKAEAVVVGEVSDGLQRIGVDFDPIPVNVLEFQVLVTDSIKGKVTVKQTMTVTVTRALDIGQSLPPEQGRKVVLFLKWSGDCWVSVDKWFGMQPHSRALVEHLKRVNSQAKAPHLLDAPGSLRQDCCGPESARTWYKRRGSAGWRKQGGCIWRWIWGLPAVALWPA